MNKLYGFKAVCAWEDWYGVVEAANEKEAEEKVKAHVSEKQTRGASLVMIEEIKLENGIVVFYTDYKGD